MSIRSLLDALQKPLTQKLIFIGEWKTGGIGNVPKAKPVPLDAKPYRVWTLYEYDDKNHPPKLPYNPIHTKNAFMEDHMHDWQWKDGTFHYYGRVAKGPVWVLLEYK